MGEVNIVTPIRLLLFGSCPSAVGRLVISVIIDPVERKSLLERVGHVVDKARGCFPSVTHLNSSASVPFVVRVSDIVTAFHHSMPCLVKPIPRKAMRFVEVAKGSSFFPEATATGTRPSFQISDRRNVIISAITDTDGMNAASSFLPKGHDRKSSKPVSNLRRSTLCWYKTEISDIDHAVSP